MGQLAFIIRANVHRGMAGGKFAKVSHPGLGCAHRVVGWAGQMAGESNLGQASCAGTGKKGSLN